MIIMNIDILNLIILLIKESFIKMIYCKFSKKGFFGLLIFTVSLKSSSIELSFVEFLNKYNNSFSSLYASSLALSFVKSLSISSKDILSKSNLEFLFAFIFDSFYYHLNFLFLFL